MHHACTIAASCNVLGGLSDHYCSSCSEGKFLQRLASMTDKQMQEAALDSSMALPRNLQDPSKVKFSSHDKNKLTVLLRDGCKFVRHPSLVRYCYHIITSYHAYYHAHAHAHTHAHVHAHVHAHAHGSCPCP